MNLRCMNGLHRLLLCFAIVALPLLAWSADALAAAGWQEALRGHPKLFYVAAAGAVFGIIYLWRRYARASWDFVTMRNPVIQQLPALVLSGLISAAPALGQDFWTVLLDILEGVILSGVTPIVAHHVLKATPAIPYGNPPAGPPAT